jgi:CDP-glucose 4,6-dehydratase
VTKTYLIGVKRLFNSIYKDRRVLVTGHTGFKGSWLCRWLELLGADVTGYSLSPLTQPNHFDLLSLNTRSHIDDVRDYSALKKIFSDFKPEIVFHLAAQPSVLISYDEPHETFSTNVLGTVNLLEVCRKTESVKSVVIVTTDKVYKNNEWVYGYREVDELGGHDPYSASKACSEIVTASYRKSFNSVLEATPLIASARAGNVIGGGDWTVNRIVTDAIVAASKGAEFGIRNPLSQRPWQHVLEPLSGYLLLGQLMFQDKTSVADAWNFGPSIDSNLTTEQLVELMHAEWPKIIGDYAIDPNARHEAGLLMVDSTKAKVSLGWDPIWDIENTVRYTIEWYRLFIEKGEVITDRQIALYMEDALRAGATWATT